MSFLMSNLSCFIFSLHLKTV